MLLEKLNVEIREAMKAKESMKRDTLRAVVSDIKLGSKEAKHDFNEEEQMAVLSRHVKQVKESIDAYSAGGRDDLVAEEKTKLEVLVAFLPKQLTEIEIRELIEKEITEKSLDTSNKGLLMKNLMPLFKGKADGKLVNSLIGEYAK